RLGEVDGHRGTHDAQPDEGDVGHDQLLVEVGGSVGAAGGRRQPGERVGLGAGAGGLVLQPEPAAVTALEEVGGPPRDRRLAGAGLVPAGGVGDLHVCDAVGIGGARRVDVVAVGDQVVHVEEQADVSFSGTVDGADRVRCGLQRVGGGAGDRLHQHGALDPGDRLGGQGEVLCGQ